MSDFNQPIENAEIVTERPFKVAMWSTEAPDDPDQRTAYKVMAANRRDALLKALKLDAVKLELELTDSEVEETVTACHVYERDGVFHDGYNLSATVKEV